MKATVTSRDSKKEVFDEVILGDNALVEWVLYGHVQLARTLTGYRVRKTEGIVFK
jgi:hypothetical protein